MTLEQKQTAILVAMTLILAGAAVLGAVLPLWLGAVLAVILGLGAMCVVSYLVIGPPTLPSK